MGAVDADKIIDGSAVSINDRVIGLASSGMHSNGFSLARKVLLEKGKLDIKNRISGLNRAIGLELLEPTRIYAK